MNGIATQLALVAVLVLLNAAFAGSEMALISLREGQIDRLKERSRAGRTLARLVGEPNRFLSTIQVGITLAGFLASATAAVTLSEPLVEPLSFLGGAARPTAVVLVTVALSYLTLVFGELAPKRLAMQRAEGWALLAARPLSVLATLAAPAIWVLSRSTDVTVRLLGGDPERDREEVTPQDVHDLVTNGELYSGLHRRIITDALEVADRTLRQIIVPRPNVIALPDQATVEDALATLTRVGHSRAPVFRDGLDDADRYVSVLGLVGREGVLSDHAEPTVVLPESAGVLDALYRLQRERRQLAIVISEHGVVEGIVTVEDLVEELVGEIYDEYDRDVAAVVREPDGSLELLGRFPVHDLADVGVETPASEATTVAGVIAERLGRLPSSGDRVRFGRHTAEVLSVRNRVVDRVRLSRSPTPPDDHEEPDDPSDGAELDGSGVDTAVSDGVGQEAEADPDGADGDRHASDGDTGTSGRDDGGTERST